MTFGNFVVAFHSRLDKISKFVMIDELKDHLLPKRANLDIYDRNLVVEAADKDFLLQALATSLRNSFWLESLPPASINTIWPLYRLSSTSTKKNSKSRVYQNNRTNFSPKLSSLNSHMFYTSMSSDNSNKVPWAVIISGSCCSVVRKNSQQRCATIRH